jgi:hypothetical protein
MQVVRNAECLLTTMPDGGGVLVHLTTKVQLAINATGVCLWKALQGGPQSSDALAAAVVKAFDVGADVAANDVAVLVKTWADEGAVFTRHVS